MAPAAYVSMTRSGPSGVLWTELGEFFEAPPQHRSLVVEGADELERLWQYRDHLRGDRRIAVLGGVNPGMRAILSEWFSSVVTDDEATFLPAGQLVVALAAADAHDRFIGGFVSGPRVVLYRGSLQPLFIDRTWFRPRPTASPDFERLSFDDFGQTIVLGEYEVAADAVLYEFDPDFRRRAKAGELDRDGSFGGSLRRIRLQKGISRSDFPGLNEKSIARIERNEVERPRGRTLHLIARRLGVRPEEIGTF